MTELELIDFLVNDLTYDQYKKFQSYKNIKEQQLKTTEEKLKVAIEALEFYGEPNNWDNVNYPNMFIGENDCVDIVHENTECCGGNRARQTLKQIKKQKDMK